MNFFLIVLLFLSTAAAHDPGSCYYINQMAQMGAPRDQGNIGSCYANASADLIGYHLKIQNTRPLSSLDFFFKYNFQWQKDPLFRGGSMIQTLQTVLAIPDSYGNAVKGRLDRGFCPVSLEEMALRSESNSSLNTKMHLLMDLKDLFDAGPSQRKKFLDTLKQYAADGSFLGQLNQERLFEVFNKSDRRNFFLYIADLVCGPHRIYNYNQNLQIIYVTPEQTLSFTPGASAPQSEETPSDLIKVIDERLNRNAIVGIDYNNGFLVDSSFPYVTGESHASVVVGRRWKNGECQYLIRNSWGKTCAPYSKYIDECVDGNIWIAENHIENNMSRVTYIRD